MQVMLPPKRIKVQLVEVTNESKTEHDNYTKATHNKKLEKLHAIEPHAEPQSEPKDKPKVQHKKLLNET